MIPLGVLASRRPAAEGGGFTFTGVVASAGSSTSNTMTIPIGSYTPGRTVVLAAWHGMLHSSVNMAMIVDSVSATEDIDYGGVLNNRHNIGIYRATNPTGTTCEVTVTVTSGSVRSIVYAWTYPGALTLGEAVGEIGTTGSVSRSVSLPSGGVGLAIASHRDSDENAASWSWSGATLADSGIWTSAATIDGSGTVGVTPGISVSTALVTATYEPA